MKTLTNLIKEEILTSMPKILKRINKNAEFVLTHTSEEFEKRNHATASKVSSGITVQIETFFGKDRCAINDSECLQVSNSIREAIEELAL